MLSNRFAFAVLAAACISAAAAGGYLASRQNAVPTLVTAAPSVPSSPTPTAPPAPNAPVQETEAVVGEKSDSTPKTSAAAGSLPAEAAAAIDPAPVSAAAAAKRRATRGEPDVTVRSTMRAPATARPVDAYARPETAEHTAQVPAGAAATPPSPVTNGTASAGSPQAPDATSSQPARADDRVAAEPRVPEPPVKTFDELVVSSDSVIGLQTENTVTSETARIEDRVDARVTRDVRVGDRIAVPAGSRAIGSVTQVERGGKFKERARLGIRFHTLVLADGTRVPISTETITRDGEPPTSAAKIGGGAVGGAIIGAILGGAKGAAIGGAAGAGAGAAASAAGDRNAAKLPAGTQTTVRILSPITLTVER